MEACRRLFGTWFKYTGCNTRSRQVCNVNGAGLLTLAARVAHEKTCQAPHAGADAARQPFRQAFPVCSMLRCSQEMGRIAPLVLDQRAVIGSTETPEQPVPGQIPCPPHVHASDEIHDLRAPPGVYQDIAG